MSNEKIKKYLNDQRMKSIEMTDREDTTQEEKIQAPLFGLDKWRKENGLTSPEMEAYIEANREQKLMIVICTILITVIVNYLRYGVP